ncbi:MAG: class I SAM-dependent methyltransferase [Steroidobacterales bacterium]
MTPGDAVSILPPLRPDEARQAAAVLQAVRDAIATRGGWLAFDDYLRIVLYAPGLGYYSGGSEKFGRSGDFVTAPEVSGLFGRCVARQCAEVLQLTGGDVLELGAGTGTLAAGVLATLCELGSLPQNYYILEISADLRARGQQRLSSLPEALRARVRWLDALPAEPIAGVILANEVADALPFKRFVIAAGEPLERGLTLSARGELFEAVRSADAPLRAEIGRVAGSLPPPASWPWPSSSAAPAGSSASWPWPDGYASELCPMLGPWIGAIGAALGRGAALIIDYGLGRPEYYHPQRSGGTLRCHFRHRAHEDPLRNPGLQDITAWVDFTRVAEAADAAALAVAGYCTQAAFLLANGIEADLAASEATLEHARLASQARQLLLPGEMGETFKVMALTRALDAPLRGFEYQDLRRSL